MLFARALKGGQTAFRLVSTHSNHEAFMSWNGKPLGQFVHPVDVRRVIAGEGEDNDLSKQLHALQDWADRIQGQASPIVPAGGILTSPGCVRYRSLHNRGNTTEVAQAASAFAEFVAERLGWKEWKVSKEQLGADTFAVNWTASPEPGEWVNWETIEPHLIQGYEVLTAEQMTKAYFADGRLVPLKTWLITGRLPSDFTSEAKTQMAQDLGVVLMPIVGGRAPFLDLGWTKEEAGAWYAERS